MLGSRRTVKDIEKVAKILLWRFIYPHKLNKIRTIPSNTAVIEKANEKVISSFKMTTQI